MARLITRRRVIKAGLIAMPTAVAAGGGGIHLVWAAAEQGGQVHAGPVVRRCGAEPIVHIDQYGFAARGT